jgi:isopenicillin-N N-acyltransferase-like protein
MQNRPRSIPRQVAVGVLVTIVALILLYTAFLRFTYFPLPDDSGAKLPRSVAVESSDQGLRFSVGGSWLKRKDGVWLLQLSGSAREIGNAHGLLVQRIVERLEGRTLAIYRRHVGSGFRRLRKEVALRWRHRSLLSRIPAQRVVELASFARTVTDTREYPFSAFQRFVYYHGVFDDLLTASEPPPISSNTIAAWGRHANAGRLVIARSLTLSADSFDKQKMVIAIRPRDGFPYVTVAWPSMIGAFAGVNARKLFVSVSFAETDAGLEAGIPALFICRELLERCDSIKCAVNKLKRIRPRGSASYLIADGKTGRGVVVEKSPRASVVRKGNDSLVVTNHFMHSKYKADAANDRRRRYSSSGRRHRRLRRLLARFSGRLDPITAARVLRDRGADLALGHRAAIDDLRATHGMIVDLPNLTLWVCRGPNLIGKWTAFDLRPLLGVPLEGQHIAVEIDADALFGTRALREHRLVEEQLRFAARLSQVGAIARALEQARRALELAPKLPRAHYLVAELLWQLDKRQQAKEHYRQFIKLGPAFRGRVERAQSRLTR